MMMRLMTVSDPDTATTYCITRGGHFLPTLWLIDKISPL